MWQARSTALVALALALSGFGCGSEETRPSAPPAPSPAPSAPQAEAAPAPTAKPVVPAPPSEALEWSGSLPSDFPPDVPQYPGSKVSSARGSEQLGMAVTLDSPDSPDAVTKFYSDMLASMGWQTQTQTVEDGSVISGDKEGKTLVAVVHAGGQGTIVELIVGETGQTE